MTVLLRDVENDPGASAELADLGFHAVPVVVLAGRPPLADFTERDLAAAIGLAGRAALPDLAIAVRNLNRLLGAVQRAARQLKNADLDIVTPQRGRDMRELIHDVFFKALHWAPETGSPPRAAGQRDAAARCPDVECLVRSAENARTAVHRRFTAGVTSGGTVLETADGGMPAATAAGWLGDHTAHHLRQIYWLMDRHGVAPRDPLDPAGLPGVCLQDALW